MIGPFSFVGSFWGWFFCMPLVFYILSFYLIESLVLIKKNANLSKTYICLVLGKKEAKISMILALSGSYFLFRTRFC